MKTDNSKDYLKLLQEEQQRSDNHAKKIWERTQTAYAVNHIYRFQNSEILEQINIDRGTRLLEVGCGIGNFLKEAVDKSSRVFGVDLGHFNSKQAHINTRYKAKVAVADGKFLPFKPASFDIVVAKGIIHHLVDPSGVFSGIHRVLKPGSRFVIFEGDPQAMYRRLILGIADLCGIIHEVTQFRHLTSDEIAALLYKTGFRKVKIKRVSHPFIPIGLQGIGNERFWKILDKLTSIGVKLPFYWYLLITAEA